MRHAYAWICDCTVLYSLAPVVFVNSSWSRVELETRVGDRIGVVAFSFLGAICFFSSYTSLRGWAELHSGGALVRCVGVHDGEDTPERAAALVRLAEGRGGTTHPTHKTPLTKAYSECDIDVEEKGGDS